MRDFDTGNLVDEHMQGDVTVRIFDGAYRNVTQDEIEEILDDISQLFIDYTNRK